MNVCLIDIDSKIPNLALKKVERYYLDKGCNVVWNNLTLMNFDKIYVSSVFIKSKGKLKQFENMDNCFIGGTGYDLKVELPKEIYDIKPRINIDFATRGCIRKCSFCFVPQKEGSIRAERDLYDIWDGKRFEYVNGKKQQVLVTFLDNNILALPDHFKLICKQAQREKIQIDFNQGLDIRLVNDEIANIISKTKFSEIRFALDHVSQIDKFDEKLKILRRYLPKFRFSVYVLVGFDSIWEDDMKRLEYLKSVDCRPYVMRHEKVAHNHSYANMSAWANQRSFFMAMSFENFNKIRDNRSPEIKTQIKLF